MNAEVTTKFNCYLLKRANNKIQSDSDTRDFVKFVLRKEKVVKPKEHIDKVHQEALKRSIKKEDYWEAPPHGWKGTRLQWYQHKHKECDIKSQEKNGERVNSLKRFGTIRDLPKN